VIDESGLESASLERTVDGAMPEPPEKRRYAPEIARATT
jgi:hypothetical protein